MSRLEQFLSTNYLPPHGYCLLWLPELIWLHVLANTMIALAYFSIPVALWHFAKKRPDLPFRKVFLLFATFITLCGLTHIANILIFWWPAYGFSGLLMLVTGIVSMATALLVWRILPVALKLPGPSELAAVNQRLSESYEEVERKVRERTDQLEIATQALKESEEQFRQLANSIPQLAWMTDQTGWISWYNQRWYDYTGTTFEQMQGWGWERVHDPKELSRVLESWRAALASGEAWQETFPLRRHDGEMRWHLSRALPIRNEQGAIVRWFGTNTDITDERAAVSAAQAANSAKTEFLANMSHEIRTPMNAVVGLSNLLSRTKLDQRQTEFVKTLNSSAKHLMALINDILDFAKAESGMIELETIPFDMQEMLHEVVQGFATEAKNKHLHFSIEHHSDGHGQPLGDPHRIRQIVTNLLSNAVKFTEKGDIHVVSEYRTTADGAIALVLSVRDSGIGMSAETQQRIFEKFTQADASITRHYGGTGLGLAITKKLVELMGGSIALESAEGQGSSFTVTIPLQVPAAIRRTALTPSDKAETKDQQEYRVLLVEDYAPNVLVALEILGEFGYPCTVARNGNEALALLSEQSFDVILMDIQMPEMDGIETTRRIRSKEQSTGRLPTPIIAMTAHAMKEDKDRCLDAGMDDYLAKPFNPEELRDRICLVLSKTKPAN